MYIIFNNLADFNVLLPQYPTMKYVGSVKTDVELKQLVSSSPLVVREIPPVFVFPGLAGHHSHNLQYLVRHLMYPVHCVVYADNEDSFEKEATKIAKVRFYLISSIEVKYCPDVTKNN